MAKSKVYSFRMWDPLNGVNFISKSKATRKFIEGIRGGVLESTEEEVDEALLTTEGQYWLVHERQP